MKRYFPMTEKAQQFLWSKLSNGSYQIPTQFLVEGDKKDAYNIMYVDNNLHGFDLLSCRIRSLYAVKRIIEQLNKGEPTGHEDVFTVGVGAWRNYPIPSMKNNQK